MEYNTNLLRMVPGQLVGRLTAPDSFPQHPLDLGPREQCKVMGVCETTNASTQAVSTPDYYKFVSLQIANI